MAVFRHEAPPLGHSSPGVQEACWSPQLTEQPAQLPRGEEGGTLQELPCPPWSEPGEPEAAVLGGPVSSGAALCGFCSLVAQPEMATAPSITAATSERSAIERGLMSVAMLRPQRFRGMP
jgi:hypothetical protein